MMNSSHFVHNRNSRDNLALGGTGFEVLPECTWVEKNENQLVASRGLECCDAIPSYRISQHKRNILLTWVADSLGSGVRS